MDIAVVDDTHELSASAADRIERAAAAADRFTLGLSGGSTPAGTYAMLGARTIDWSGVTMWLSDERWVPHDHPDSNGRMALEHLPAESHASLLRPRWSPTLEPDDSAAFYEAELRSIHEDAAPDMVLLGMGDDGHTASLFPGTDALHADPHRWFVANQVRQLDTWRLTSTATILRAARETVVLVAGAGKAGVLAEVLEGPDGVYPIQLLREASGSVTFLCDRAAASGLTA